MTFSSACYSCNIATVQISEHDDSAAAARNLPGWRSKVVDGLWGGGENSCREPFSQLRRVNGARPLPSAVRRLRLRCRLNEGRVHVDLLDRCARHLAARLHERHRADSRRRQPRARPGVAAPATDWCPCYGRIELWRAEDTCSKRSRAPDPGGHGGGWRGVWRCRGAFKGLMPYGNIY